LTGGCRALEFSQTTEDLTVRHPPRLSSDDFFREVNDRIVELGNRFGFHEEMLELICECDDTGCTEHLSIPTSEYELVREAHGRHVVAAGHPPCGRVVARGAGYVVVED
jgi:hypothetical protein